MTVLHALRTAFGSVRRNPAIVLVAGAVALLQLPSTFAQSLDPLVGGVVSLAASGLLLLLAPFIQGGLIGMAAEALDGETDVGTFLDEGKSNYLQLLGAYVLLFGVNFVLGVVVILPLVFGSVFVFGSGASVSHAVLAVVALIVLLGGLAYVLAMFFLQFYAQAIVLDGQGIVGGFRRSAGLVRRNLASTAGYTALAIVVGGLFGIVVGASSIAASPQTLAALDLPSLSTGGLALLAVVIVAVTAVSTAVLLTFSVAFYTEISGRGRTAAV